MGQVYYDMGFLSSAEVFECSATDLVGQYVGHTGPKTIAKLDQGLGKILFIDEAYRLAAGQFASEAVNELVDQLTKPQYLNKIVVILAGYDQDINKLISTNPGLSSRFPEEVVFRNMTPEHCIELLQKKLKQSHVAIPSLNNTVSSAYRTMCDLFKQLAALPSFGNGREVETLAKNMLGFIYQQPATEGKLTLSEHDVVRLTKAMLYERQHRSANMPNTSVEILPRTAASMADPRPPWASSAPPPAAKDQDTTKSEDDKIDSETPDSTSQPVDDPSRDLGVPDAIWEQLQADKEAHELEQQQEAAELRRREDDLAKAKAEEAEKARALQELAKQRVEDEAARREIELKQEAARLAEQKAREARERMLAELERARREQERKRQREERAQKKLKEMGVCVAGFRWIKQTGGWRCAGGSHFVGDKDVGV